MAYIYISVLLIFCLTHVFSNDNLQMEATSWTVSNFSFKNCDPTSKIMHVSELNITPHPIKLGPMLFLNANFNLTKEVGNTKSGIETDVKLELKTPNGYTSLCEIVGDRFCYWNLCNYLEKLKKTPFFVCPSNLKELTNDCECPLKEGNYQLKNVPFHLAALPFEVRGTFVATSLFKVEGKHIGCVEIHVCVNECMF